MVNVLFFMLTSFRISFADDLQNSRSFAVCSCTWLTKLYAKGMVMHTDRMATRLKVTAEYATNLYAFSLLSESIV